MMTHRHHNLSMRQSKGFSLIEIVIVIVIAAIIVAITTNLSGTAARSYTTNKDISQLSVQGNLALERIAREIRLLEQVTIARDNMLTFTTVNGDVIGYDLLRMILRRRENVSSPKPLATNVSALAFTYLDRNAVVTTNAADVYFINIALQLSQSGYTQTVRTTVQTRNCHATPSIISTC